ncbi:MAG: triose-phosphate isomerase [Hydrogenibacillus schlegelii]|uniref:Triosephosphate isomerase n=1 Tax=Hydrogenibacillus schlegelii TaxID=1484 RepID=A0A947G8D4_HYDSH|nr:triose-phosphate isomerase [Hydrogenibacillus schlegelii]
MRTPLIAANWKMHKTWPEAATDFTALEGGLAARKAVHAALPDVVVCPPYPMLALYPLLFPGGASFALGAQNVHHEASGAYTGEVSAPMLTVLGVAYVIVGHSERRRDFGEDAVVGAKVARALEHDLTPIVCVGETLDARRAGETEAAVGAQLAAALAAVPPEAAAAGRLVIAYEPVWAIGTGAAATPEAAQAVARFIRAEVAERFGAQAAEATRILYGGSVTADNLGGFLAEPDIDGALVGGASLDVRHFLRLVDLAAGRPADRPAHDGGRTAAAGERPGAAGERSG